MAVSDPITNPKQWTREVLRLSLVLSFALALIGSNALAQSATDQNLPKLPGERALPGETGGPYPDPLEPFN